MNAVTGKPLRGERYEAATVAHCESVLRGFYPRLSSTNKIHHLPGPRSTVDRGSVIEHSRQDLGCLLRKQKQALGAIGPVVVLSPAPSVRAGARIPTQRAVTWRREAGQVMLLRVVTTRADIPRTGEGIAFVHGEIEPKISAMDGNRGFAMAVDWSSGLYVGIAAWTDPEALKASGHDAPELIADIARRLHGSKPSVEVFDVVLAHVVKPVRIGYWGRFTRLEVPVQDFARAVQRSKETVLAMFDRYDGLAGIILFVDWTSGVLESITWYDSLRVLRGSATRAEEVRELILADVPTGNYVELCELEVVIAEIEKVF